VTAPQPAATTPKPGIAAAARRHWLAIVVVVIALAVLAGGWMGFSYLFLRPAAPAAVGLIPATPTASASSDSGTAASPAASDSAADPTAAAASNDGAASSGGLDGTWNVDPSVGSFSDFSSSFVGYRVEEELANIGAATAVGRTPDVAGSLTFDGTTVTAGEFTADLSTLQSDRAQRDGQLHRQALETDTYPTATFKLTQPIDLGTVPADGQVVQATATGDLTIHGTTKSVQIPLQAKLSGDVVTVTGSIDIVFADYGISRPNSFMVLSIADHGTMEFQLQLTKG
jgi:polyisoprenoid-binding protein YceI